VGMTGGMSFRVPMKKSTSVALVAGALGVAVVPTSAVAAAKGFDLTAGTAATKGNARGVGTVDFLGPQKVRVQGTINDICPKDGYGAYIEFKFNFKGGGYATRVISDQRKCKAAPKHFAFTTPKFGHRVMNVGVTVIELDQTSGGSVPGDAARVLISR
jgi:hypothetical protein